MRFLLSHPGAELYGSDRVLVETAAALIAADGDVTVVLPTEGALADVLRRAGCTVLVAPTLVLRKSLLRPSGLLTLPFRGAAALARAVRLLRRLRPDVLYVNTVTLPIWLAAGRLTRTPTVLHVHEAERDARRAVRLMLYLPSRLADVVIANSRFTKSVIASTDPKTAARTVVVHNGVPGPQAVVDPRQTVEDGPRLAYVGRLSPRKGTDLVIAATARLVQSGLRARAEIVGEVFAGYEWYRAELGDLSRELNVADAVRFTGFSEDIWPELAACDILIVPSRLEESFGNSAVEGLLAARSVVASDLPGLREATAGSNAVLVPADDADAIVAAVTELCRVWPTARAAALADAARTADLYSPARYRARMAEVIVAARESRRRRRGDPSSARPGGD